MSMPLLKTPAQKARLEELGERFGLDAAKVYDEIPAGAIIAVGVKDGRARWVEVIEPVPSGKYVWDLG
jgi:hypothetical protein